MQTISEPSKSVTPSESTAAKTQILLATLRARALAWHISHGEVTDEQQKRAAEQLKERRKRKKPKSPQSQTSPEPSAPPVAASPVDTTPPDPVPTTRPVLKLKPKAGTVTSYGLT